MRLSIAEHNIAEMAIARYVSETPHERFRLTTLENEIVKTLIAIKEDMDLK